MKIKLFALLLLVPINALAERPINELPMNGGIADNFVVRCSACAMAQFLPPSLRVTVYFSSGPAILSMSPDHRHA